MTENQPLTRAAVTVMVAAAALLAPEAAAEAATHGHHHARPHHDRKHTRHAKHRHHRKTTKAAAPSSSTTARSQTVCSASPGLVPGTTDPFEQHMYSAHLERSPGQQVQDAGDVSTYVAVHTALLQAMAQPSLTWGDEATTVLQEALAPFIAHLYAAHLEQSPTQQAAALMNPSSYALTHTVLVEQMMQPVLDYVQEALAGQHACSTTTASGSPSPGPSSGTKAIEIQSHMFMPQDVSVPAGTTVTWTNDDADTHNVEADGGAFKSKNLDKGASFSYTFAKAGTYTYYCSIHPDMKGKVTVG